MEMNEYHETGRIAEYAQEIASELDMDGDEVAEWLIDWAIDWNTRAGIIFQIAATQEFGAKLSDYTRQQAKACGISLSADFDEERAILRYIHNNSSARTMTLYRSTDHDGRNALESWTTDREIAQFYVERNGGGRVIERTFNADQVLGTYRDGIGLECANEVIVIN